MFKRLVGTSFVDVYALAVGLVSLTITARILGPDGRGIFVVATSLASLFASVAGMSVERVLIFRAVAGTSPDWPKELFSSLLIFWMAIVFCIPILLVPIYLIGHQPLFPSVTLPLYLTIIFLTTLIVWHQLQQALLLATDKIAVFNRSKIAGATASAFLVIVFVTVFDGGVMGAIWGVVLGHLVEIHWGLRGTKQYFSPPKWRNIGDARHLVGHGLKLHINTLGNVLRLNADVLMLNAFIGPSSAGLFQLAMRLIDFMLIIPSAAAKLFQGQIVKLGPAEYWLQQKYHMRMIMLLLIGALIVAYGLAPLAVPFVFGAEFSVSAIYFQWLLPVAFGKAYGVMMATQAISRGYLWLPSFLGIGAAALNVGLNLLLIPLYGTTGAIIATVICFGLVPFIINTAFFIHYERIGQRPGAEPS